MLAINGENSDVVACFDLVFGAVVLGHIRWTLACRKLVVLDTFVEHEGNGFDVWTDRIAVKRGCGDSEYVSREDRSSSRQTVSIRV